MTRKNALASAAVALALAAAFGAKAASDDADRHGGHRLRADLKGLGEVPLVSSSGRGSFRAVINDEETEIAYQLNYSSLEGAVTQAHIHVGQHQVSGGISVWLCGTAAFPGPTGTPTCGAPGGPLAEAEGVITAASIVGPATQGIGGPLPVVDPATEFAQLITLLRSRLAYVNVHSSMSPGGEIRGQIKVD